MRTSRSERETMEVGVADTREVGGGGAGVSRGLAHRKPPAFKRAGHLDGDTRFQPHERSVRETEVGENIADPAHDIIVLFSCSSWLLPKGGGFTVTAYPLPKVQTP
jgi:hypothetical protein